MISFEGLKPSPRGILTEGLTARLYLKKEKYELRRKKWVTKGTESTGTVKHGGEFNCALSGQEEREGLRASEKPSGVSFCISQGPVLSGPVLLTTNN